MLGRTLSSSFRLFRLFGIDVHLHSTWFFLAAFELGGRRGYSTPAWNMAEFLAIFVIVLLHEFGHALACRSVGGEARQIVLWPLGGVAFVRPPHRPGAVLWSIAAGPLVNVLLLPITLVLTALLVPTLNMAEMSDLQHFIFGVTVINLLILIFNLLPIYPLDGGQIVQSLLWMVVGYQKALSIAAGIGLVAAAIGGGFALWTRSYWMVLMAAFIGWQAWVGWKHAQAISRL